MREHTHLTRRELMQVAAAVLVQAAVTVQPRAAEQTRSDAADQPFSSDALPRGVRARFVNDINGIRIHVLEAGFESSGRPLVLLLHGFPELAYSWRKVMPPLAAAGYHVIAPDVRGNGRTSGWDVKYDDDLRPFRSLNKVRDMIGLVAAFGYRSAA